jgi:tetratricopeptide (TPR) repeat protein
MDFEIFKTNRCQLLLRKADEAFRMRNPTEGEQLLNVFIEGNYYDENSMYSCNPASVYSAAGSYYFKTGNTAKAKAALKKGLTYDPDNYEIKTKLKELN